MIRILGAVLVIGATGTIGLTSMWRMGMRVRILTALIAALETMKGEICDRLTPMPELIVRLSDECDSVLYPFFGRMKAEMGKLGASSFYFIWKRAIEHSPELELSDREKMALIDLGRTLGRYDVEEQRSAIGHTMRRMEGFLKKAEDERRTGGKVHAVLGLIAGIFVVIMLL